MKRFLASIAVALSAVCSFNLAVAQNADNKGESKVDAKADVKDPTEASVKSAVQARLGASAPVESVRRAPIAGLWEARIGDEILYTDAQANYLMIGNLIDAKTRQNLTQARLDEINKVSFKDLPLDLAIKAVRGKGERVLVEFADPNCGYCKRFRQGIANLDNVTIYTFLMPILSPDSTVKAKQIWCSGNKAKAWDDWMSHGITPMGSGECSNPIDRVIELGQKLKVTGTPTLFFSDGRRVAGAIPADKVEAAFAQVASNNAGIQKK